jgi:hypothetical protein
MYTPMSELASQHVAELRQSASRRHRPCKAAREQRESIRTRAGWTLIKVGLKLTDPPASGRSARPHPAGL